MFVQVQCYQLKLVLQCSKSKQQLQTGAFSTLNSDFLSIAKGVGNRYFWNMGPKTLIFEKYHEYVSK